MEKILKYENLAINSWNGGTTKEYFRDKNEFGLRISTAIIDKGKSKFSDFTGYDRLLTLLKSSVNLTINGINSKLRKGTIIRFKGADKVYTDCKDEIIDFNIIWKTENFKLKMDIIERNEKRTIDKSIFILSTKNSTEITVNNSKIKLDKFDGYLNTENNFKTICPDKNCIIVSFVENL